MKVTLEVAAAQIDHIVVQELKRQYDDLESDLRQRQAIKDSNPYGVFENDKEADCIEIQKHMDAFAKVLSYNMAHQDFEDWQHTVGSHPLP
jgi:hypothetical protein|tara:strand:- start:344 stop:616 length:273 start_codon:yes stop_codon:yes gene_type:complete